MKWLFRLLGIKSSIEKKKDRLILIQKNAFNAQRNGDLRLAGKYLLEAEILETKILEEMEENNERR